MRIRRYIHESKNEANPPEAISDEEWQLAVNEVQQSLENKSNPESRFRKETERASVTLACLWVLARKHHEHLEKWASDVAVVCVCACVSIKFFHVLQSADSCV